MRQILDLSSTLRIEGISVNYPRVIEVVVIWLFPINCYSGNTSQLGNDKSHPLHSFSFRMIPACTPTKEDFGTKLANAVETRQVMKVLV
jgi:hypothetical protein